jgi:hypothetical protein
MVYLYIRYTFGVAIPGHGLLVHQVTFWLPFLVMVYLYIRSTFWLPFLVMVYLYIR